MTARGVLVALALIGVAVLVGRQLPIEEKAGGDIAANERACSAGAPRGFASYPITRLGELRGCLYVDEVDPARYKLVRRVLL